MRFHLLATIALASTTLAGVVHAHPIAAVSSSARIAELRQRLGHNPIYKKQVNAKSSLALLIESAQGMAAHVFPGSSPSEFVHPSILNAQMRTIRRLDRFLGLTSPAYRELRKLERSSAAEASAQPVDAK